MEYNHPDAAHIAADCLSILALTLACRTPGRIRIPLEIRLLGALAAELAGWVGDEWADWRTNRPRRGRRC